MPGLIESVFCSNIYFSWFRGKRRDGKWVGGGYEEMKGEGWEVKAELES